MKDLRQLKVWKKTHQLTPDVYATTAGFPRHEMFGITSQMRRCSMSIGANIAESCGKSGNSELHRFLQIASSSASELEYLVLLAEDLSYLTDESHRRIERDCSKYEKC